MDQTINKRLQKRFSESIISFLIILLFTVSNQTIAHAGSGNIPFSSNGIFGVPVENKTVVMSRTYANHDNEPRGIDLSVPVGTPVYAPFSGTLQYKLRTALMGSGQRRETVSYGLYLELTANIDGQTYRFLLGHMSEVPAGYRPMEDIALIENRITYDCAFEHGTDPTRSWLSVKDRIEFSLGDAHQVNAGDYIGKTGDCGYSTGAHAHIELYVNGKNVNPDNYITNRYSACELNPGGIVPSTSSSPVSACSCSALYAGTYVCTTASSPLNIRSGHSTGSGKIGSIPSGAFVEVTAANGVWAHVTYQGVSGYASMQYLRKSSESSLSFMGTKLVYTEGSTYTGRATNGDKARGFIDYCQNLVYGENYSTSPKAFSLIDPSYGAKMIITGSAAIASDCMYVCDKNDGKALVLIGVEGTTVRKKVMSIEEANTFFAQHSIMRIEFWSNTGAPIPEDISPTVVRPEIIIHIDSPSGTYTGSNHIEITGWIASKVNLTYVMTECEAFGQMNLTGNLEDAAEELDSSGYVEYPVKKRFRSVLDRKYLQPNTTYTIKVWAGMENGASSGVCSQTFDITSITPVVIQLTKPSASAYNLVESIPVEGTIVSLNPITNVLGRVGDISNGSAGFDFNLSLSANQALVSGSDIYTCGYSFSGNMPIAAINGTGITATCFVTAVDVNSIRTVINKTFALGKVVADGKDINDYIFDYDSSSFRMSGTETHILTGYVYAHAPIADVMCQVRVWDQSSGTILMGNCYPAARRSGYEYAVRYEIPVSAGDLQSNKEYRIDLWCDLVNNSGHGEQKFAPGKQKIYADTISEVRYTVSYNANGGNGAPGSVSFLHGKSVTISSTVPTRTGYNFIGWSGAASSRIAEYTPGSSYSDKKNITLYAVWEAAAYIPADIQEYDLTANITIGNAAKVFRFVSPEKTQYSFTSSAANIKIQDSLGNEIDSINSAGQITKNIVLNDDEIYYIVIKPYTAGMTGTVRLKIVRGYAIRYDANGGVGAPEETMYQVYGESIEIPAEVPTHGPLTVTCVLDENNSYTKNLEVSFSHWATYDYLYTVECWPEGSVTMDRPTVFEAEWLWPAITEIPNPTKEGYEFAGWKDQNGYPLGTDSEIIENITVYAQWNELTPLEGIEISPRSLNLKPGNIVQLTVSPIPADAVLPELQWVSSNPQVAVVDANGLVTVCGNGNASVTVMTMNETLSATSAIHSCSGHITAYIQPVPADYECPGTGLGEVCMLCNTVLKTPEVISVSSCMWLPAQTQIIDRDAFNGVAARQIVIPEGTSSIGSGAFRNCENLLLAVIPASVEYIAADAFIGCPDDLCVITPAGSSAADFCADNGIFCFEK